MTIEEIVFFLMIIRGTERNGMKFCNLRNEMSTTVAKKSMHRLCERRIALFSHKMQILILDFFINVRSR